MGANLAIKGADFSAASIGFVAPVMAGLEFWNYLGDTLAKTARNLVVGKPGITAVGAPVINPGYVSLKGGSNFLQTGLVDQSEVTLLAVSRIPNLADSTYAYVIGSFAGSGAQGGSSLLYSNSASTAAKHKPQAYAARNASGTDAPVIAEVAEANATAWGFHAVRIGAAYHRIDDKTRGLSGSGPITNPRSAPNGQFYRIGSSNAGTASIVIGDVDVAFATGYSRCLTDAEVEANYQRVKAYLASKGITV